MTTVTTADAATDGVEYTCRYCRQASDPSGVTCPRCGAPIDVRATVSRSGWVKQPPIKDMARIQFGQSRVQIEGRQVPVADFLLAGEEWIYFGHHALLWTDPGARLQAMDLGGGWKRMRAGLPVIMLQGAGPGHIALADSHSGEIVALPLQGGQQLWVREHRFLAATGNISYSWENQPVWYTTGSGDERKTHHPLGWIGDLFQAQHSPGLLLLHAPGNVFLRDLGPGESMLIQPSALLYRDIGVQAHLHIEYPHTNTPGLGRMIGKFAGRRGGGLGAMLGGSLTRAVGSEIADQLGNFGGRAANMALGGGFSHRTVWLRLIGPGRVAVQSVYEREDSSDFVTDSSPSTSQYW